MTANILSPKKEKACVCLADLLHDSFASLSAWGKEVHEERGADHIRPANGVVVVVELSKRKKKGIKWKNRLLWKLNG